MGQLLIRNVDDGDIRTLKAQAERERISLEQKLRDMVHATARDSDLERRFQELTRGTREQTRGANLDIDVLLQEDRERDGCTS